MERLLLGLVERYCTEVALLVLNLWKQDGGRGIVGAVAGRPGTEDREIRIDRECDLLFRRLLREFRRLHGTKIRVYSEHGIYGDSLAVAQYYVAIDPFDGSGLFRRKLPAEWWSVLTIFDSARTPIIGAAVDILRREIYLAAEGEVTLVSFDEGTRRRVSPATRTSLGGEAIIAAFLMDPGYLFEWTERVGGFQQFPNLRFWPNGGSCIYPWLAQGRVHAYVMFREPRSEIDPGLGFASVAGLTLVSVGLDGALIPYQYDPRRQRTGRVSFFVAACTKELAQEIVRVIGNK